MSISHLPPIVEAEPPSTPHGPSITLISADVAFAGPMAAPFRIEFRSRDALAEAVEVLVWCDGAEVCRAQVESYARRMLDERRSGEVHLVESLTNRSLAHRPVWPAGATPRPEWVAWSRHTLLPRR